MSVPAMLWRLYYRWHLHRRPDSVLNDISVYNFQLALGTKLAQRVRETGWDVDCIVPVPDGSRPAAIQLSSELGLPYREVKAPGGTLEGLLNGTSENHWAPPCSIVY